MLVAFVRAEIVRYTNIEFGVMRRRSIKKSFQFSFAVWSYSCRILRKPGRTALVPHLTLWRHRIHGTREQIVGRALFYHASLASTSKYFRAAGSIKGKKWRWGTCLATWDMSGVAIFIVKPCLEYLCLLSIFWSPKSTWLLPARNILSLSDRY